MIIDNRLGAASNIATEMVAHAQADGYTLLAVTSANAINSMLYDDLDFDFLRDIAPVALIEAAPFVMVVNPSFPAETVPELIAYAKANPGRINMASPGNGSVPHVAGELFKMMTGIDMVHIPYRVSFLPDLLSGQVQVTLIPIAASIAYVRTGQLRAIAVTTAARSGALPDVPTVGEFVPGYEASGWLGVGAPRRTSADIIGKLNTEISVVVADSDVKARLVGLGCQPMSMTPAEFGKFVANETEKWGKVIKFARIKSD
jgi:tripartite-type tricarboxylate transporter receptor subunit TctC